MPLAVNVQRKQNQEAPFVKTKNIDSPRLNSNKTEKMKSMDNHRFLKQCQKTPYSKSNETTTSEKINDPLFFDLFERCRLLQKKRLLFVPQKENP